MHTPFLRLLGAALVSLFIVSACASDTGAQWTFAPVAASDAEGSSEAAGDAESTQAESTQAESTQAESTQAEGASGTDTMPPAGEARVIELVATAALQFTDPAGTQIKDIPVTPGETVTFRIDNTAGFDHNFYIGTDEQLMTPAGTTDTGIPSWQSGVQELTWTVPADLTGLKFGCTVPGHYTLMQGTFSVSE